MGRTVTGVLVGAVLGLVVAALFGWLGEYVFPPSVQVDMNPTLARTLPMPMGEVVVQLMGWILSGLFGGYVAARIAGIGEWPAWASGGVMAVSALIFAIFWPHPLWFVILCVLVVAASGFGAGRLGGQVAAEPEEA
jgi:hypothetical protein